MSLRQEFVKFSLIEGSNIASLCRRFNISRKTGYKWIKRYLENGCPGLVDRSRRPKKSPNKTHPQMERVVLTFRDQHNAWGGRKIRKRLQNLGWQNVPAASTITAILKRNGCIEPCESLKHKAWRWFEANEPNDLWQMDFKGHFDADNGRCHPLTLLDDHSRYSLALRACKNERTESVRQQLERVFHRYGLPKKMLMDNGSPWGTHRQHTFTPLTMWLIRQGVGIIHSRPYHPQTLGKDERFHRTFKAEVGQYCIGLSLEQCQQRFDTWRDVYNFQRPHESLDMQVPVDRYRPSKRAYRQRQEPIEYGPEDQVRKVQQCGRISYRGKEYKVPKAFTGQRVAVRPTATDGLHDIYFCNHKIAQIDENQLTKSVTHVPERV